MIRTIEIMDVIKTLAAKRIPALKRICFETTPGDLERPSLLIEFQESHIKDANADLVEKTEHFILTLAGVTDDYSNTGAAGLLALQAEIIEIFKLGYLKVGDRALKVSANSAGRYMDKALVEVQFTFLDKRSALDERNGNEEDLPMMDEVFINANTTNTTNTINTANTTNLVNIV